MGCGITDRALRKSPDAATSVVDAPLGQDTADAGEGGRGVPSREGSLVAREALPSTEGHQPRHGA
eukprot:14502203-Alexandrium_andersonii.AAC.1